MIKKRNTAVSHVAMQNVAKHSPVEVIEIVLKKGLAILQHREEMDFKSLSSVKNEKSIVVHCQIVLWHRSTKVTSHGTSKLDVKHCLKRKIIIKYAFIAKRLFLKKSNRDRHIKRIHANAEPNLSQVDAIDTKLPVPTLDSDMEETTNMSFLSEDGSGQWLNKVWGCLVKKHWSLKCLSPM